MPLTDSPPAWQGRDKQGKERNAAALNFRVLIIDNDAQNADALITLLMGWGCAADFATTDVEALEKPMPDLLIIDYHLGEHLTGFMLLTKIEQRWQGSVPSILVTAHAEPQIKVEAAQRGMGFLAKPVKPIALRALIKSKLA